MGKVYSHSREIEDTLRALRRAARRALELGIETGTPVYVVEDGKIVDLTKRKRPGTKTNSTKTKSTRAKTTKATAERTKAKTTNTAKPKPRRSSR